MCAWTAFVLAGGSFQKLSEHFTQAVPARDHTLPNIAFGAVFAAAIIGGLLVLSGAAIALPALGRFLRAGGWASVRPSAPCAGSWRTSTRTVRCSAITMP